MLASRTGGCPKPKQASTSPGCPQLTAAARRVPRGELHMSTEIQAQQATRSSPLSSSHKKQHCGPLRSSARTPPGLSPPPKPACISRVIRPPPATGCADNLQPLLLSAAVRARLGP
ncbi:hypothetical protein NDU88_006555 [Pleurodeles waltl]|uniref:Uncharacterized protein n=1 Tax=Pleurodeles waltl TaxID=8319 RepID=A0AAV7X0K1_PLEWA|nr:hypothetical protein NDU88_006555 [Pleurodeles waltl]